MKELLHKKVCSNPHQIWESECQNQLLYYIPFLRTGEELDNSPFVKTVALLKYWCDFTFIFKNLNISKIMWRKT